MLFSKKTINTVFVFDPYTFQTIPVHLLQIAKHVIVEHCTNIKSIHAYSLLMQKFIFLKIETVLNKQKKNLPTEKSIIWQTILRYFLCFKKCLYFCFYGFKNLANLMMFYQKKLVYKLKQVLCSAVSFFLNSLSGYSNKFIEN